jgi:hypothetical protein
VLTLHLGAGDDAIRISISHVPFRPPPEPAAPRMSLEEIQRSLTDGWVVPNSLEGNMIFRYSNGTETYCSWKHPDSTFDSRHSGAIQPQAAPAVDIHYESLSYVWGDAHDTVNTVVVSSTSPTIPASMRLPVNLHLALNYLRHSDKPRVLWVDAICIDQINPTERSLQVQRMHLIYNHALRVVVWLGSSVDDAELAMSTLSYFGQQIELTDTLQWAPAPDAK